MFSERKDPHSPFHPPFSPDPTFRQYSRDRRLDKMDEGEREIQASSSGIRHGNKRHSIRIQSMTL